MKVEKKHWKHNIFYIITHSVQIPYPFPNTAATVQIKHLQIRLSQFDMSARPKAGESSHGAVALGQPLSSPALQRQLVRQNKKATQ